jgi:leucyl aminopeptidase
MKLSLISADLVQQSCDLLLLPLFQSELSSPREQPKTLAALDKALKGLLLKAANEEGFSGKAEQALLFHTHGKLPARRLLLLGLGDRRGFQPEVLRLAAGRGAKIARKVSAQVLVASVAGAREAEANVRALAEGLLLGEHRFDHYKTNDKEAGKKKVELKEAKLVLPKATPVTRALRESLDLGIEVASATNWTRDLVNEPANRLTPSALAELAKQVARECGLRIEALGKDRIEKLRMGMFLAVAQGSAEPPALIHLAYEPRGKVKKAPLALVGKAITFDSGGLSLKPSESMLEMKTDMAGAAAVLGAMRVVSRLEPPFAVHAFMGACENMPGGRAYKLGDVLVSRLGKTVEVTNTDAEGRLVLGDVLAWANEHKPAAIVDLATLTGACVVALGSAIAGVLGNDETWVREVLEAGKSAGEELWRLPLSEPLREGLKSEVADMKNTGDRWGGAITAALFLKEFVGETPWVHVDIAGPSMSPKERGYLDKGATGIGVRTLVEMVRARARAVSSAS